MMIPKYFTLVSERNFFVSALPFANGSIPPGYAAGLAPLADDRST
jgi:hypothetical protein